MTWLLTRGRVPYLALLAAVTVWLGLAASRVTVERNNESLKTHDPAQEEIYERFKATFGSDEDLLLAVAHPSLLSRDGLSLIADLTERVERIDGVRRVYSLTNAQRAVPGEAGAEMAPVIDPALLANAAPADFERTIDLDAASTGLFLSADRRVAGLLVELDDLPDDSFDPGPVIDDLRALMAQIGREGVELHLTGIAVQKHDVTSFIERDQRVLIPLALVILAAVLASFFRRVLGVILPLAVTGVTVLWTLGTYSLAGLRINAITSLLPPVLMVLSLAVSIHLLQGWFDAPAAGKDASRVRRIMGVVHELWFPCFFCALVTAFGFASLVTNDMPAVQQFGAFAAFGTMVSFAVGITLVPVGLTFLAPPGAKLTAPQHRIMRRVLVWSAGTAGNRPWLVLGVTAVLTLVSITGIPLIRNNTDLVRFLKSDAPLFRDTMFIDAHLTGVNTFEYVVARRDGAPMTGLGDVQRMAAFEEAAAAHPAVTGVSSVVTVLRQLQRAENGPSAPALPDNERDAAYAFDLMEAAPEQDLLRKLASEDFTRIRFNVRLRAIGTAEAAPLAAGIRRQGRRVFGGDYEVDGTGAFYHVARDSDRLVRSQAKGVGSALVFVFVTTALVFRSLRFILVALVAYVVPLVWTGGLMGAVGIDLSTGTVMIASAVLGMVVDDTIHYIAHFRRVMRDDVGEAIRNTSLEMGAALVTNNMVQVLGFWVGCFGSFKPTIYFSLLSGLTMISALLCDLLVTPAILTVTHRRRPPRPSAR